MAILLSFCTAQAVQPLGDLMRTNIVAEGSDVTNLQAQITSLSNEVYYAEPNVSWASGGATYELGYTLADVNLDFTCNKAMVSRDYSLGYTESLGAGQNNTFTDTNDVTSTTSFRITVVDDRAAEDVETKTFTFTNRKYTGASANEFGAMLNSDILALTTEWETKGDSGAYALTDEYIYVCYPASLGACTSFSIGGFGSDPWTTETRSVTNSSGFAESYILYHSINKATSGSMSYDIH